MRKPLFAFILFGISALIIVSCAVDPTSTPVVYPETERGDVVDVYFGEEVADPYRWLEDLDGEEVAAWVAAQNAVSMPFLEAVPQHEAIKHRLTELWDYERYGIPEKEGGRYFFTRNDGLQDQSVLYVAKELDGEARILIDPNLFSDDGTIALSWWSPSPDGRWIAYSTSDGGTDWKTWHIRNEG